MDAARSAVDLLIGFMRTPIIGGWLSVMHIIMGVVVFEVGIMMWKYFAEKLGY